MIQWWRRSTSVSYDAKCACRSYDIFNPYCLERPEVVSILKRRVSCQRIATAKKRQWPACLIVLYLELPICSWYWTGSLIHIALFIFPSDSNITLEGHTLTSGPCMLYPERKSLMTRHQAINRYMHEIYWLIQHLCFILIAQFTLFRANRAIGESAFLLCMFGIMHYINRKIITDHLGPV